MTARTPRLLAISDLHVSYPDNRELVTTLAAEVDGDWLIVAGDVAEKVADVEWALAELAGRFDTVIWVPGNHELWTPPKDPVQARGVRRYQHLVEMCRSIGVRTPEDEFLTWPAPNGPVIVAPLFLLYDYTFRPAGTSTKAEALAVAREAGVVCTDEYYLHPDPHPTREQWCADRVRVSRRRLDELAGAPCVLINHWPLLREPTRVLRYPEFAQWCGTESTADWHLRFNAVAVVYGHLHIPRSTTYAGVRFEEVSMGYPREWRRQQRQSGWLREILPGRPA